MKNRLIKVLCFLLISTGSLFAQNKDAIIGKWLNQDGSAQISIYQTSGKYHGRIMWLKDPLDTQGNNKIDKNNPEQALRRRPLIGSEILKNFSFTGDKLWEGGTIYDPRTGRTYSCIITMVNSNKIDVRGFVGISMLGRTESWSRMR